MIEKEIVHTAKTIYTVEYSTMQEAYHIETLDRTIMNNLKAVNTGLVNGYLVIGIFSNYEAAQEFIHRRRAFIRPMPSR